MRYALIMAGGSGTRLWPMSRKALPKQLLPIIGGRSLLEIALERLEGLVPSDCRYVCAGEAHAAGVRAAWPKLGAEQFLGEPCGRDTLNAVGLGAAVIARRDPEAVISVFTADHIIEPVDRFLQIVALGFEQIERHPEMLVTFGVAPTRASTGFGYLELGDAIAEQVRRVEVFHEKPEENTAQRFFEAGASRYLWNSGMFVWRAATLLDCIRRYHPANAEGLERIAAAWDGPDRNTVLAEVYPTLEKISVDFAVMEPASRDPDVGVLAVPMNLQWLDVGSWDSFAETCPHDEGGNARAADRALLMDTASCLVASNDPGHLITTIGCEDLIIIHTPDATLVCPKSRAEAIKELHRRVGAAHGDAV